jgi:hypothetical protein
MIKERMVILCRVRCSSPHHFLLLGCLFYNFFGAKVNPAYAGLRQLKEKKIDKKGDINYGDSESEDCPGVY